MSSDPNLHYIQHITHKHSGYFDCKSKPSPLHAQKVPLHAILKQTLRKQMFVCNIHLLSSS